MVSIVTQKHTGEQKTSEGSDCLSLMGCRGVGWMKGMGKNLLDGRERSGEGPENETQYGMDRSHCSSALLDCQV